MRVLYASIYGHLILPGDCKAYKRVNSREAPGISFPPTSKKNQFHIKEIKQKSVK
jgi:hypothetical protein